MKKIVVASAMLGVARLDSIAVKLKDVKDPSERSRLSSEYTTAAAQLPPVERLEALDRLATL